MVSNTITYARPITYRWDLRWGRHPCGILSYLYQKVGPYWEVRLTGLGLSRVVCVEAGCVKFRPQTSTSVSIGDSWWEERFLMVYFWSSFVALGGSNVWYFWSFSWCMFPRRVSWMRFWCMVTWLRDSCDHCCVLGAIFTSCIDVCLEKKGG